MFLFLNKKFCWALQTASTLVWRYCRYFFVQNFLSQFFWWDCCWSPPSGKLAVILTAKSSFLLVWSDSKQHDWSLFCETLFDIWLWGNFVFWKLYWQVYFYLSKSSKHLQIVKILYTIYFYSRISPRLWSSSLRMTEFSQNSI